MLPRIHKSVSSECLYSQSLDQTGRGIISQYLVPVDQMRPAVRLQLSTFLLFFEFFVFLWYCKSCRCVNVLPGCEQVLFCIVLWNKSRPSQRGWGKKKKKIHQMMCYGDPVCSGVDPQICFPVSDQRCGKSHILHRLDTEAGHSR